MANREQLQPLVKAAVKRAAERQRAHQQEHLTLFRQALEKVLSPQVKAALELSYQWNAGTDQPVAVCAVQDSQGGTCEIFALWHLELWSASLASGAELVHRADARDFEEQLLVALEALWQGECFERRASASLNMVCSLVQEERIASWAEEPGTRTSTSSM
jgi:hypothetical protein